MALKKIRLGDYLIPYKEKCGIPDLTPYDISGVNKDKEFFEPSRQTGEDTTNYQNVPPGYFACNLMHVGRDKVLPIAYNHTNTVKHVSPAYSIFRIKENNDLLDYYFFIYLKSDERDRFFWFNTDASIRDGMTWDDLCNVELNVPPLPVQQKYVDVYNTMLANQKVYERGLDDLKLTCDAYIENLRKRIPTQRIGQYIKEIDIRNKDMQVNLLQGFCMSGEFIEPRRVSIDIPSLKILEKGNLVYNRAVECVSDRFIVAQREDETCAVSNSYIIFTSIDEDILLNKYLLLWLRRSEFARYSKFMSHGTAHENFEYCDMEEVKIPIPDINIQKTIVSIYEALAQRKTINDRLKNQIKDICPILIKGSIEEARKEA